jgi:hypothetical protein
VIGFGWLASAVTEIPASPGAFINPQTWPILLAGAGIGFMFSAASTDAVNRSIGASYGEVTAISQTMRNFGGALGIAIFTTIVTDALTTNVTASFTKLGATAANAHAVVQDFSGAGTGDDSAVKGLSSAVRQQFLHAVQTGYADAVSWAFVGAAIAMAVVVLLAFFYPRGEVSSQRTEASAHDADSTVTPGTVSS